jgi:hypothetical protein
MATKEAIRQLQLSTSYLQNGVLELCLKKLTSEVVLVVTFRAHVVAPNPILLALPVRTTMSQDVPVA